MLNDSLRTDVKVKTKLLLCRRNRWLKTFWSSHFDVWLKELHFNSTSRFTHQLEEVGMAIDLFVNVCCCCCCCSFCCYRCFNFLRKSGSSGLIAGSGFRHSYFFRLSGKFFVDFQSDLLPLLASCCRINNIIFSLFADCFALAKLEYRGSFLTSVPVWPNERIKCRPIVF